MAIVDGPKYAGSLTVDLSDVKDDLVDLPPGAMKGIRAEQDGIEEVTKELAAAMPAHGDAADVPPQAYQRFVTRSALLGKLRAHEMELEKALEIIKETRAKTENDREDDITTIVRAVTSAASRQKNPGLAAPFQKTIAYNGQIAEKGVQTRKKNAEAKAGEAKDATPPKDENGQSGPGGQPPPA